MKTPPIAAHLVNNTAQMDNFFPLSATSMTSKESAPPFVDSARRIGRPMKLNYVNYVMLRNSWLNAYPNKVTRNMSRWPKLSESVRTLEFQSLRWKFNEKDYSWGNEKDVAHSKRNGVSSRLSQYDRTKWSKSFSIDCRNSNIWVITTANQNKEKYHLRTNRRRVWSARKRAWPSCKQF